MSEINLSNLRIGQSFELVERSLLRSNQSEMSAYSSWKQAILELTDNAFDNIRLIGSGKVIVNVSKDEVFVYNEGGPGLTPEGLSRYLSWGRSDKLNEVDQIGRYGVGGKKAAGFLGGAITIRCSALGSDLETIFTDPNWNKKPEGSEQRHQVHTAKAHTEAGYFAIKINSLNSRINERELTNLLGEIYKPILEKGNIQVKMNGDPVKPQEIVYDDNLYAPDRNIRFDTGYRREELALRIAEVGIMNPKQRIAPPGLRLFHQDRLITRGVYIGVPSNTDLPQSSNFIGDVHIDGSMITTNTTKTDFHRDSFEWGHVTKILAKYLTERWGSRLRSYQIDKVTTVTTHEQNALVDAKTIFQQIAFNSPELTGNINMKPTRQGIRYPLEGEFGSGGLSGEEGLGENSNPIMGKGDRNFGRLSNGRATLPAEMSDRETRFRTRLSNMADWQVVPMGNEETRVVAVTENNRQVIKINADFPLYQVSKGSRDELMRYLLLTGGHQLRKILFSNFEEGESWYEKYQQKIGEHFLKQAKTSKG